MPRATKADLAADVPKPRPRPAWHGSTRNARLPKNWGQICGLVKRNAAGRCQCPGCPRCTNQPCTTPGCDVDHINRGDNHRLANLQLLCGPCHAWKSSHEGGTSRPTKRAGYPTAANPGLLT